MKKEGQFLPELRFSEFYEKWVESTFKDLATIIDCKHRTPPYVDVGVPVISPGTIRWGEIDLESPTKRVTEEEYLSLMDHCSPEFGDMVFSRNQSIGVASILLKPEKFVLGQDTVLIKPINIHPFYLYQIIQTFPVQRLISKLSGGSTFSRINLKDIRQLKMSYSPMKEEQQKIASFLTAVDKKIEQLTRKKELLEQYKKGVMQKIFSQEIRFKDDNGENYPDWEEKRLGDVFTIKYGRDYKHLKPGDIPVLGTGGVMTYVDEFLYDKPSVLIGRKGSINSPRFIEEPFWTVDTLFYTEISEKYVPYLVFQQVSKINWMKYNEATGVPSLNTTSIRAVKIDVPASKNEQKKIANFLSSIDTKINTVQTQLNQTQNFKKGLLQKMFV